MQAFRKKIIQLVKAIKARLFINKKKYISMLLTSLVLTALISGMFFWYKSYSNEKLVIWCEANVSAQNKEVDDKSWIKAKELAHTYIDKCTQLNRPSILTAFYNSALASHMLGDRQEAQKYARESVKIIESMSLDERSKVPRRLTIETYILNILDGTYKETKAPDIVEVKNEASPQR